jgi:hypothetical protein
MSGGLTNFGFMSLTFDPTNARVIPADTFTNTQKTLPFIARLGTLADGPVLKAHPLSVLTEVGKVTLEGNGVPNDVGEVKFTLESLNTRGRRPKAVDPNLPDLQFDSDTGYSACDPLLFPTNPKTPFPTLARNWRSTMIYYIKGSEYSQANNPTGVFDASKAFGIWDVNQNGFYDGNGDNATSIDKITSAPAGRTNASFNFFEDDWFWDLPSPFVDANENGRYDPGELLVGDEFTAANGKFDENTFIWKSTVIPLYLGATAYSLLNSGISSTITDFAPTPQMSAYYAWLGTQFSGTPFGTVIPRGNTVPGVAARPAVVDHLFGRSARVETPSNSPGFAQEDLYFHAHDKCGNPLPGGKKISATYESLFPATIGKREVTTHFYIQPADSLREPSKRLLAKSDGSSEATMNQDVLEHPAAAAGFPIELKVRISPCENFCSGDLLPAVANAPPAYCSQETGRIDLNIEGEITVGHPVLINEYFGPTSASVTSANKCGCAIGATRLGSTCTCPTGTSVVGNTCTQPP